MIRSKRSSGDHGRPMCTSRVRLPDCFLIQRAIGSTSLPALITTSGQGAIRGLEARRLSPAMLVFASRLEIIFGTGVAA